MRKGPALFAHLADGPSLDAHRRATTARHPLLRLPELASLTQAAQLTGRGGAGFPFATKLRAVAEARGRPVVVVNLAEGEPASWKDSALALTAPHLVLDGAVIAAQSPGHP